MNDNAVNICVQFCGHMFSILLGIYIERGGGVFLHHMVTLGQWDVDQHFSERTMENSCGLLSLPFRLMASPS